MTKYQLYYWDIEGRAEFICLLFHYAGVEFEDIRFPKEDWPQLKKRLAGTDDLERAQIDALISHFEDFFKASIQSDVAIIAGFRPGDKDQARKNLQEKFAPGTEKEEVCIFEKYIKEADNGFYFKSGLTWADFFLNTFWGFIDEVVPGFLEQYPKLKEAYDLFYNLPKIKEYYETYGHDKRIVIACSDSRM
uniref:glutathione transferase n=1 Tax=Acrobeloides nanus TaxID=290746 RepID=A0A914DWZ8_9BILA